MEFFARRSEAQKRKRKSLVVEYLDLRGLFDTADVLRWFRYSHGNTFDAQHVLPGDFRHSLPSLLLLPLRDVQTLEIGSYPLRDVQSLRNDIFQYTITTLYFSTSSLPSAVERYTHKYLTNHKPSSDNSPLKLLPHTSRIIRSHGISGRRTWDSQTSVRQHDISSELISDTLSQVYTSSTAERHLEWV
jgi:hypothetical protein